MTARCTPTAPATTPRMRRREGRGPRSSTNELGFDMDITSRSFSDRDARKSDRAAPATELSSFSPLDKRRFGFFRQALLQHAAPLVGVPLAGGGIDHRVEAGCAFPSLLSLEQLREVGVRTDEDVAGQSPDGAQAGAKGRHARS